ncbi:Fc.00g038400.m01.CDS01 [Cosmosporella sp. VM-42]
MEVQLRSPSSERQDLGINIGDRLKKASPDAELVDKFPLFHSLGHLPAKDGITYLNTSFAPPPNLVVHEAITRYSSEALHDPSPKSPWQPASEETRNLVARYINADSSSIAFTRDTTEALGNIIRSIPFRPGDNVVILDSEHPNHAYGWMALRAASLEVRQVPTIPEAEEAGTVTAATAATFAPYVDDRTRAIGLSSIMFHSGQWNDVTDICTTFRPRGIHVLADLTQQGGFARVDVTAMGVSAAAFSLHKGLSCPTGFACHYVQPNFIKALDPTPLIVGYGAVRNTRADLLVPSDPLVFHPSARRYEHPNLSLVGAAAAKAFLTFYLDVMGPENVEAHLYRLGDTLRKKYACLGIEIVGPESRKLHAPHPYILKLKDPAWVELLKINNVRVTPYRLGMRVSFGFYNNLDDVDKLVEVLRQGVEPVLPLK